MIGFNTFSSKACFSMPSALFYNMKALFTIRGKPPCAQAMVMTESSIMKIDITKRRGIGSSCPVI